MYVYFFPSNQAGLPVCGREIVANKWILLFVILLLLTLIASFNGHFAGIVIGYIYLTGIPGFFQSRQAIIKYFENLEKLSFLTTRDDFRSASDIPYIDHFNFPLLKLSQVNLNRIIDEWEQNEALAERQAIDAQANDSTQVTQINVSTNENENNPTIHNATSVPDPAKYQPQNENKV